MGLWKPESSPELVVGPEGGAGPADFGHFHTERDLRAYFCGFQEEQDSLPFVCLSSFSWTWDSWSSSRQSASTVKMAVTCMCKLAREERSPYVEQGLLRGCPVVDASNHAGLFQQQHQLLGWNAAGCKELHHKEVAQCPASPLLPHGFAVLVHHATLPNCRHGKKPWHDWHGEVCVTQNGLRHMVINWGTRSSCTPPLGPVFGIPRCPVCLTQ